MTKKRQPNSSIVSILEDDNLNIPDIDEDSSLDHDNDDVNYMEILEKKVKRSKKLIIVNL